MDLISRKAAIDRLNAIPPWNWSKVRYTRELWNVPSVRAVPLEPLARWIVENLDPRCDCNYCFNEDTDFEDIECCNCQKMSEEQVKEALTKWMEEQDAAD